MDTILQVLVIKSAASSQAVSASAGLLVFVYRLDVPENYQWWDISSFIVFYPENFNDNLENIYISECSLGTE